MRADVGKELNLSVIGGAGDVIALRPLDENEQRIETAGKTFYAELRNAETDKKVGSVGVTYTESRDVVLTLPEMGVGQYVLVVEMSAESGNRERFASGWVTYMEPGAISKPVDSDSKVRLMGVVMDGERRRCMWYHTSAAEIAADRAEAAADRAEDALDRAEDALDAAVDAATKRAEDAADRAEDAADRAEKEADEAKASSTLAEELKNDLRNRLLNMIKLIDGYLYIDDVNTGHYLKGKDGLQVYISSDGHWYLSDGTYLGWPATGDDGITPHITADGYWAIGDEVTNYKAVGKDGLDGTAVRRILVDSYADIPQEGETCNGGYYYYTKKAESISTTGSVVVKLLEWKHSTEKLTGLFINGVEVVNAVGVHDLGFVEQSINEGDYGCTAQMSDDYERLTLTRKSGVSRLEVRVEPEYYTVLIEDGYAVYAWIERQDGAGQWMWVGLANDIATAEVLGLVKLGTDTPVTSGAPVGTNMQGQMHVGLATVTDNGTGKISVSGTLDADSGGIGRNANGQYVARKADNNNFGTVKFSRTDDKARLIAVGRVPNGTKIDGRDRGGLMGITRADASTYGGCKVSASYTNKDDFSKIAFVMPIGMRNDTAFGDVDETVRNANSDPWYLGANGCLVVRLKQGGAIQWVSAGQSERHGRVYSTGGHLQLRTTGSFTQSENDGLTLNPASANLLGGVFRQETLASGTSVPTGSAVLAYLNENYYTKSQTYTRSELTRDGGIIELELKEKLPIYAAKELVPYLKKADAAEQYAPISVATRLNTLSSTVASNKTSADNSFRSVFSRLEELEKSDDFVRVGNSGIHEFWEGTVEEFSMLPELDANVSYIVLEG